MTWKKIDFPQEIADCENSKVLFTLPIAFDHIKNWKELGRTGAMTCCFRPNTRKTWTFFGMSNIGEGFNYGLSLDNKGLKRRISSIVSQKSKGLMTQGMTMIKLMHRTVSYGDYCDFRLIAEYALKRVPFIASDLCDGIEEKCKKNMWYCHESKKVAKQMRGDWKFYQEKVSRDFYDMFCNTLISREDLPSDKVKELITLVSPLRVEPKDTRYKNIIIYNPEE